MDKIFDLIEKFVAFLTKLLGTFGVDDVPVLDELIDAAEDLAEAAKAAME